MEAIVGELQRDARWRSKVKTTAVRLLKRINWLKVARKTATAALAIPTGGISLAVDAAVDKGKECLRERKMMTPGSRTRRTLTSPSRSTNSVRIFASCLSIAEIKQLVVIVDDLDRCLLPSQSTRSKRCVSFFFVEGTAFIIAADEALVEYAFVSTFRAYV